MVKETEILQERYILVMDRIREIAGEHFCGGKLGDYFTFCAEFLMLMDDTVSFLESRNVSQVSAEELEARNRALYADILPDHYEVSYGNPAFAVKELGEEH